MKDFIRNKIGILHFASYNPDFPGSFIESLINLNDSLHKDNIKFVLMFPFYKSWHAELTNTNVYVEIFPPPFLSNPFVFVKLLFSFRTKIKKFNIKIIHCHFSRDYVLLAILYKILFNRSIVVIWHIHSWPATLSHNTGNVFKSFYRDSFYKIIGRVINKYITVSPELYSWLSTLSKKVAYIPNGISLDRFNEKNFDINNDLKNEFSIPDNSKIICSVANFRSEKDHLTLLHAFKEVVNQVPNVFLFLVGDGPTKKEIEDLSKTLHISQNIVFTGTRKDVERIIYFSELFILSTHGEGLPYVLCEAMASKKAVIATNVRGCRDIVTNESGLLVAHGDFAKLAEGIVFLLSNPEVAADMGKNGRKLVEENYTLFKQSSDIINIYNEYIW